MDFIPDFILQLYEVRGATEIPTEGIATIQLRFLPQLYFGDIYLVASGHEVESPQPYKLKLAKYKLHIHNFHKDTFFKDSFGKYSYIKTIVYLLGSQNRLVQDVMVPLQVSLRYEDNIDEEVPSTPEKPSLNLFDLRHRLERGCSLIPFRIEVVSSSHNNRSFVFYVQPEANSRFDDGSIIPCISTPIEVKARLRPFNPERTPPKYNANRYRQEQDAIRHSARELLESGTVDIPETFNTSSVATPPQRKSSPSKTADLDISLEEMTLSDNTTSLGDKKATTPSNPRTPITPISIKTESRNTQSARSIFRYDQSSTPSTPQEKSRPQDEDDDDEDWVINFRKNSLVISGIELDRWEEKILRGTRNESNISEPTPSSSGFGSPPIQKVEDVKPASSPSPFVRAATAPNPWRR